MSSISCATFDFHVEDPTFVADLSGDDIVTDQHGKISGFRLSISPDDKANEVFLKMAKALSQPIDKLRLHLNTLPVTTMPYAVSMGEVSFADAARIDRECSNLFNLFKLSHPIKVTLST